MCAIVPLTPVVVTLPLTVLSSLIMIVPLPAAALCTGGTSWLPLRLTCTAPASALPAVKAMMASAMADFRIVLLIMFSS